MPRQIRKTDNLCTPLPNLLPTQLSRRVGRFNNLSAGRESHDLHADGGGAAGFDLVFVTKQIDASFAAAVVQTALD